MASWQEFTGFNRGYVLELYERYRQDPASVDAGTRALFEQWTPPAEDAPELTGATPGVQKIVGAVNLAQSIRRYGHLAAQLDPLGSRPLGDPGAAAGDARRHRRRSARAAGDARHARRSAKTPRNMLEVVEALPADLLLDDRLRLRAHLRARKSGTGCGRRVEAGRFRAPADPIDPGRAARSADAGRGVRTFLHRTFPGKTRFSIEGLDMLVPILDEVIGDAAESGIRHVHRHGAPRAAERDGARAGQAVRADPRRVQGSGLAARRSRRTWRGPAT